MFIFLLYSKITQMKHPRDVAKLNYAERLWFTSKIKSETLEYKTYMYTCHNICGPKMNIKIALEPNFSITIFKQHVSIGLTGRICQDRK